MSENENKTIYGPALNEITEENKTTQEEINRDFVDPEKDTEEKDAQDQPEYAENKETEKIEQGDEMPATENLLSLALKRSRTEYAGLSLFNIARIIKKELKDQNEIEYLINELRGLIPD